MEIRKLIVRFLDWWFIPRTRKDDSLSLRDLRKQAEMEGRSGKRA